MRRIPLLLPLLLAGCAGNAAPPAAPRAEAEPRLVGCARYTPPLQHWRTENRFWVRVTVKPDGTVAPGTAQHLPSHFDRGDAGAVAQALRMAESCVFEPAQLDGEGVASTARLRFAFDG